MTDKDETILRVVDVTKSFDGIQALEDVSFGVKTGHIKALIGPNGAGKTTLLNAINGILPPDQGHIHFLGHDVVGQTADRIASLGLSRTFQLIRMFTINNATVLDNVMLGAHMRLHPNIFESIFRRGKVDKGEREARERAMELLKFVGLENAHNVVPTALSFGNQRLVELARSLMTDPKMLLLDEPASGLNDTEVDGFTHLLLAIRNMGITILLVEHNMKLVMNIADDIVVLDFGKKLAEGTPQAICANPEVIEAYLGGAQKECVIS
ncbi:MAG: transporter ATP-binding protein [Deltaproteobacteria bacterium]|jgi:branched-chain amino acid transport system ATP-binding protein|nr:transporter ATP-binding protein [Deltaproteobacteria bacterium]